MGERSIQQNKNSQVGNEILLHDGNGWVPVHKAQSNGDVYQHINLNFPNWIIAKQHKNDAKLGKGNRSIVIYGVDIITLNTGGILIRHHKKQVNLSSIRESLSHGDMRWRERFDSIRIGLKSFRRKDEFTTGELIGKRIDLKYKNQSKCLDFFQARISSKLRFSHQKNTPVLELNGCFPATSS
ncbi:hypothetical protein Tco_0783790 [Tanacetum coccineum]